MRHFIILFSCLFMVQGCATMEQFANRHLKADEWEEDTMAKAWDRFERDYMDAEMTTMDKKRRAHVKFLAKEHLFQTPHVNDFKALEPVIDENLGMPEAFQYYFIRFEPRDDREHLKGASYLVVIRRFNEQIVHAGIFEHPGGDPFYRYSPIVKAVEGK